MRHLSRAIRLASAGLIALFLNASAFAQEIPGEVDAAIVFAVDVSFSIDRETALLQRDGHASALRSRQVATAIAAGQHGCIAVAYLEWSSAGASRTVLPWSVICDPDQADRAATVIEKRASRGASRRSRGRTSISQAIEASAGMLNSFEGSATRKVIDISANGTSNDGTPPEQSRRRSLQRGHVVNAIVLAGPEGLEDDLPGYFKERVVGGDGAFVAVSNRPEDYATTLRRKLVIEIGAAEPSRPVR